MPQISPGYVYVLIPWGVGAKSPTGVFSTREAAETAAADLWPKTDAYHTFVIEQRRMDRVYPDTFSHYSLSKAGTSAPIKLLYVPETEAGQDS